VDWPARWDDARALPAALVFQKKVKKVKKLKTPKIGKKAHSTY
jgi:hypothetical protein